MIPAVYYTSHMYAMIPQMLLKLFELVQIWLSLYNNIFHEQWKVMRGHIDGTKWDVFMHNELLGLITGILSVWKLQLVKPVSSIYTVL